MPLLDVLDETKRWAEEWLFPLFEDPAPKHVYRSLLDRVAFERLRVASREGLQ